MFLSTSETYLATPNNPHIYLPHMIHERVLPFVHSPFVLISVPEWEGGQQWFLRSQVWQGWNRNRKLMVNLKSLLLFLAAKVHPEHQRKSCKEMDCSYFWRFASTLKVSAAVNELLADSKSRWVTDVETQCLCVLSQSRLQLMKSRQLIPIRQQNQTESKVNRAGYSTKWWKVIPNQHILSSKDKEEGLTSQGLRQGPWLKFDAMGPLQWTQSYDPVRLQ